MANFMNPATARFCAFAFAISPVSFSGAIASAESPKPVTASVRQSLDAKLPSGMRITTLKLDDKRANINGVSPSNALISQFLRALTYSRNFTKVELVSVEQKDSAMHFYIIADVKCPTAGSNANSENLCDKPAVESASVFQCTEGGKTVFQDRPCAKTR